MAQFEARVGEKCLGMNPYYCCMPLVHFSLAFLFISRLSSHKVPSAELCTKLPAASVKEGGHSSAVFFWESPCMHLCYL